MGLPEHPVLQYRWKINSVDHGFELVYFGLRNPPFHTRNILPLCSELGRELSQLDGTCKVSDSLARNPDYVDLVQQGIVVNAAQRREPATSDTFKTCSRCVTNDYLIPGLEFNEQGVCAFCQCYERAKVSGFSAGPREGITDEELQAISAANTQSRFDVMVLCTAGIWPKS
jgi:hypothetical protein